ncbi:MAG: hypothetical protein ACI9G1_000483 [Pirellulaceae bacterium]|jgi:hypothetical protein
MIAYLLLRNSPYMAKTDASGNFRIEHLPIGKREFPLWREKADFMKNASFGRVASDRGALMRTR